MKEFDLEAAKNGAPVCTRDGRDARIIAFDIKNSYPVVAVIDDLDAEIVDTYTNEGKLRRESETNSDLFMKPEKKEGWCYSFINVNERRVVCGSIFHSEEDAKDYVRNHTTECETEDIRYHKIEWEE